MRAYETTFILVPTLDAEGLGREVDSVKQVIGSLGGQITAQKEWGRRRLAYPIGGHTEGVYHILRFELEPSRLGELERHFKLNESVMRFLLIRDEGTPLHTIATASESEERQSNTRDEGPAARAGDRKAAKAVEDAAEASPAGAEVSRPQPPSETAAGGSAPAADGAQQRAAAVEPGAVPGGEDSSE